MHSLLEEGLSYRSGFELRKGLDTALRKLYKLVMSHLQVMLQNCLFHCLSNKLAKRLFFLRFIIPHGVTLIFLFAYLHEDKVSVLGITKPVLPTSLIVVLHHDRNVLSEEVQEKMTEGDLSVLLQFKLEELPHQSGPLSRPAKRQKIF